MQVHHNEGVANRIGPESCVAAREGRGEALTGEHIGQPLSLEMNIVSGADAFSIAEGHTTRCAIASAGSTRRGRRPWHVQKLLEREPGDLTVGGRYPPGCWPVRIGKARSRSR